MKESLTPAKFVLTSFESLYTEELDSKSWI